MSVSAIDTRYAGPLNAVFDEENKLKSWLEVETALAYAHEALGHVPKDTAIDISIAADSVKLERVKEIEKEIDHDLMAMVRALTEQCPPGAGAYVHLGATSYDIEDTATALVFRKALAQISTGLSSLLSALLSQARKHRDTVCIGRTHGQHAVPLTYGLKFSVWACEVERHRERIGHARKHISVGKMSGAVGTMATFGDDAFELQDLVMKRLGLSAAPATTQIIQRDRHAEVISLLALIACTCEKIAKEVRNLQRTEIMELAEPFGMKQVGSSTMPHKRNPHKSERVCSLARVVRANAATALENIALEHERDLTNSANERIIFPESFILTDYILTQTKSIVSGLEFFPENIARDLEMTHGLVMAERIMLLLAGKGMGRQEAHELLRESSREAVAKKKNLKDVLLADARIGRLVKPGELEAAFRAETYIGKAPEIVDRVLKRLEEPLDIGRAGKKRSAKKR